MVTTDSPSVRSFSADDEPEVEVLWDGVWCFGLLADWRRGPGGRWQGTVRFHVGPGENRIEAFDEDLIRPFDAGHDETAPPSGEDEAVEGA